MMQFSPSQEVRIDVTLSIKISFWRAVSDDLNDIADNHAFSSELENLYVREWTAQKFSIGCVLADFLEPYHFISTCKFLFSIFIDEIVLQTIGQHEKKEKKAPHGAFIDCSIYKMTHGSKPVDVALPIQLTKCRVLRNSSGLWKRASEELIINGQRVELK